MLLAAFVHSLTSESGFSSSAGASICTPPSIKLSEERHFSSCSLISNSVTRKRRGPVFSRHRLDFLPSLVTPVSLIIGFGTMNWKPDSLPLQNSRGLVEKEFAAHPKHKRGLPGNSVST